MRMIHTYTGWSQLVAEDIQELWANSAVRNVFLAAKSDFSRNAE
jgi:hypothetical protein